MPSKTPSIPERFLRQLWKHQDFKRVPLTTITGEPVIISSPGTFNTDTGPDFLDALVKIGNIAYRGDVELHQTLKEWKQHSHDTDPRYNRVILHVVFDAEPSDLPSLTKSKRSIPVLVLQPYLAGPLRDVWQKMILDERAERISFIKCYHKNSNVASEVIQTWLKKLALERMELKVRRFEERLREFAEEEQLRIKEPLMRYGKIPFGLNPEELPPPTTTFSRRDFAKSTFWQQLLYEGIFEALGYSKNRSPFARLARIVRLERLNNLVEQFPEPSLKHAIESCFFGTAGLLEIDTRNLDRESRRYVQHLRSTWETIQSQHKGEVLHPSDWMFFRLRPENFPTIRIAGASRLCISMMKQNYFKTIIQTIKAEEKRAKDKFLDLTSLFIIPSEGFWSSHYRFGEQTKVKVPTLIGKTRAQDIIVNVVLPIALLYARIFKDRDVRQYALQVFEQSPSLSENSITKMIDRQLMREKFVYESSMLQQGALQLYKYYCVEERCADCAVGKIVFNISLIS